MVKKTTERKVGALLSYFSILVNVIIGFIVTPIVLKKLGDSEYGVYTLVASLCAYLNIVEQGLADTVVKYTIKFRIDDSTKRIEHFSAVVLLINGCLSLVTVIAGIVLYSNIPTIYANSLSQGEISLAQRLLFLMVINMIVSFMSNLYQGILTASEKFILLRSIEIIKLVISNILTISVLLLGGRSFSLVAITLVCNVFFALYQYCYCRSKLHHRAAFHKGTLTKNVYLELIKYFFAVLIVVLVEQIYWKLDNIIISIMLGATFVTVYSIGMSFHKYLMKFSTTISKIMTPKIFKEVLSGGDTRKVTDELIKISRLQAYGVYLALAGLVVFGKDFISLWVGASYYEAYAIILITLIPFSFEIVGNLRNVILQAHDLYLKKSILTLGISFINIVLTVVFVKFYGIVGAAIGTGIGVMIGQVGINYLLVNNHCCELKRYYFEVYGKLSFVICLMFAFGFSFKAVFEIKNWIEFFVVSCFFAILYFTLLWLIVLSSREKNAILSVYKKLVH